MILKMKGLEVKAIMSPSHICNWIPIKGGEGMLVDFHFGIVRKINLCDYYDKLGNVFVIKESLHMKDKDRKALYKALKNNKVSIGSLSNRQFMKAFFPYIQILGENGIFACSYGEIANRYFDMDYYGNSSLAYRRSLRLCSDNTAVLFNYACFILKNGHIEAARDYAYKVLKIHPNHFAAKEIIMDTDSIIRRASLSSVPPSSPNFFENGPKFKPPFGSVSMRS
jgi:tetratricopeptide (TPR) repeat protein